ncbi:MAG: efflux RND transporter periplasmic adaptor subunit [Solimonas sp.]
MTARSLFTARRSFPLVLLLGAGAAWPAAAPAAGDAPAKVRVAQARLVEAGERVRLPARLAAAQSVTVFSRAVGYVAERRVDIGDTVRRGDLLARISAPETERAYAAAKAALQQQQARETLARAEFRRAETLVESGAISASQRDAARADLDVAVANVAAARAEAERLREIVGFQRIVAPIDGRIVERRIEQGDRVSGDDADAAGYLFRIARLDELRVLVDAPQDLSLRLKIGDAASLRFAGLPTETFTATLARKSGDIDARTGTMRIELRMTNPEQRLPDGLRGEIELQTSTSPLVAIPMNALLVRDGQPTVALDDGERLHFRPVSVSHTGDREVFLKAGLQAGERVVQAPNALLREGDRIVAMP